MALTRAKKATQLTELTKKMQDAQSVIFSQYLGLTVAEVSAFRSKLREQKAEMKVAKKTLLSLAAKQAGLPEVNDAELEGGIAAIFSFGDPLAGAQVAKDFGKSAQFVKIMGGFYAGKFLNKSAALALASIPNRQVLLGTFAGMIQSPMRSFMSICNSPLTSFARALSERAKQKA